MNRSISWQELFNRVYYFFPFQLVILHFKKNHLLLLFWVLLFAIVNKGIGVKYGAHILLLSPEYNGNTGFAAFGILGFAFGGFVMAFNLYSYIMHGFRFPFIASVSRPFYKFCINNFIFPAAYTLVFLFESAEFQASRELIEPLQIAVNLFGYILGMFLFFFLSMYYFFKTNRDINTIHQHRRRFRPERVEQANDGNLLQMASRWKSIQRNHRDWRIETYLSHPTTIALARKSEHYTDEVIEKVFAQNHINAAIFEVLLIISFVLMGSFREFKWLLIPAGASFLLLITMLIMIISAAYSWFKGWTTSLLILSLLFINVASSRDSFLGIENKAYGIRYDTEPVDYHHYIQNGLPSIGEQERDKRYVLGMLENWKAKNIERYGQEKPPIIFLNCSGGGLRSSLWTFRCLSYLDSLTQGKLFDHTFMITGSSGGMLGSAFYRDLKLESINNGKPLMPMTYFDSLGRDMLNAIGVSLITNDLFIRYQNFEYRGQRYVKDRAYAFERELNMHTGHRMDRSLIDYRRDEQQARIPMLILSPTIANDGRKILISASPLTYLTRAHLPGISGRVLAENLSFEHLMRNHRPQDLHFTTALRMSATFPYIMPAATLPTVPKIDIMDAGMRDNYGLTTTIPFISVFSDWIEANTSGVYVIQLRDLEKIARFDNHINTSFSARVVGPVGSVYSNLFNTHNYAQDEMEDQLRRWISIPFDLITVEMKTNPLLPISLSWHLTRFEKEYICNGIPQPVNQNAIDQIIAALSIPSDPKRTEKTSIPAAGNASRSGNEKD
ncbi:MAG TPA: hypothetical protein VFV37_03315 [Luteibaculaceae bacterium]|nr:hypothetical protein [Luteibaculaceae bacterium]